MNAIPQNINWTPDLRSKEALKGVHPDLAAVIFRAQAKFYARYGSFFVVIEGVRDKERQRVLYGQGRSRADCTRVGIDPKYARPDLKKVTDTLNSNHFRKADGYGHATDLCHILAGKALWENADKIAACMFEAAEELNVPIRWGKDWNRNGKPGEKGEYDGPHFELWGPRYA